MDSRKMGDFYFKGLEELRETFFRSVSDGVWGETPYQLLGYFPREKRVIKVRKRAENRE